MSICKDCIYYHVKKRPGNPYQEASNRHRCTHPLMDLVKSLPAAAKPIDVYGNRLTLTNYAGSHCMDECPAKETVESSAHREEKCQCYHCGNGCAWCNDPTTETTNDE